MALLVQDNRQIDQRVRVTRAKLARVPERRLRLLQVRRLLVGIREPEVHPELRLVRRHGAEALIGSGGISVSPGLQAGIAQTLELGGGGIPACGWATVHRALECLRGTLPVPPEQLPPARPSVRAERSAQP